MVTALDTGNALATPAVGFVGTTVAMGRFGNIDVLNTLITPEGSIWLSLKKTLGLSDVYVQNNVWDPGGTTGWHTHPGASLIIVTAGTVTAYEGHDPTASPLCTHRGWGLSMLVVNTCTSSGTKAPSRREPWQYSSFRQMRCVGLTLTARGTARSDED